MGLVEDIPEEVEDRHTGQEDIGVEDHHIVPKVDTERILEVDLGEDILVDMVGLRYIHILLDLVEAVVGIAAADIPADTEAVVHMVVVHIGASLHTVRVGHMVETALAAAVADHMMEIEQAVDHRH